MGKKKAFIDKKKSVTYSLVYRDPTEDPEGEDGGQRTLAPIGGHRGGENPIADDYPDYYDEDGSVYDSEYSLAMSRSAAAHHDGSYTLSEERRRELIALGFPDDGYDYLKHMRDLGRGRPPPGGAAAGGKGGVAPIPEDQELDGFDDEDDGDGEWQEGTDSEEDFTIYDEPEPAQTGGAAAAAAAPGRRKKLDAAALAAAEAAAAAAAAAGPSTSAGAGGAGGSRAAASAAAGPGPGSARAAARSAMARSVATTARTQGSAVGPSVYVRAAKLVPPKADVKVVDARRLVVRPKGQDESAAAAALSEVTALSRHTELHGRRGRLYQDLDDVEKSMAAIENGNDANRKEVVEGDEWADWLDEFVAGGDEGAAAGGAAAAAAAAEEEEEVGGEGGGSSEEPEDEEEDADEWRNRHRRQQQRQGQEGQEGASERDGGSAGAPEAAAAAAAAVAPSCGGVGAASVASSLWRRPERRDRREGFEALDAQFERLAVEYDDDEIGALDDGRYDDGNDEEDDDDEEDDEEGESAARRKARGRAGGPGGAGAAAAGNCELSDFADVLDEFLTEHRAAEALEVEGLKQLQASDDVALQASRPDPEALAATKARLQRQMETAAAAAGGAEAADYMPVRTIVVQEAERWDCESILSLTSNLENHPAKIVEPQRRTGGRGGGLIRLSAKTGMPVAAATRGSATGRIAGAATIPEEVEDDEEAEEGACSDSEDPEGGQPGGSVLDPALLSRRKGETAEERKARKAAVKEARRNQRTAKKEMKTMFRQQATKAQKQSAGRSQAAGSTYIIP